MYKRQGVDSSFLLYTAIKYGADIKPYFIKTAFQPEFELEDAMKLASQLNIEPEIIRIDVLQNEKVTKNPKNRCYFCKNTLFSILREKADACLLYTSCISSKWLKIQKEQC